MGAGAGVLIFFLLFLGPSSSTLNLQRLPMLSLHPILFYAIYPLCSLEFSQQL